MRNRPHASEGDGAEDDGSASAVAPLPFVILRLERCEFGSKRATGAIEILGVAIDLEFDYFEPPGREPFVASRSVRSKYSGSYERTTTFTPQFAASLLAAVDRELEAIT